ncbi:MAG: hypothetical protein M1840_004941 [Geoglossum simile]|nr:MAG: hypothetical protein M1840_004941 [Geoglossum simile]
MTPKDHKRKGKGKRHRTALSLDSCFGNISPTPTEEAQSPVDPHKGNSDGEYHIIGYDRVTVHPDTGVQATTQRVFDAAVVGGSTTQIGDRLTFGNSLGHMVLVEREETQAELRVINAKYDTLLRTVSDLQVKISDSQAHAEDLKDSSDGYMRIRQRFLDTFLRDVEKIPEAKWAKTITAGNKAAHDGDAVADASLFDSGARNDKTLMVKIYGLSYYQILTLKRTNDYSSIAIINARATLKADKENTVPQDIEEAWSNYIFRLEQNWGQMPNKDPLSPLGQAYRRFWDVYGRNKK